MKRKLTNCLAIFFLLSIQLTAQQKSSATSDTTFKGKLLLTRYESIPHFPDKHRTVFVFEGANKDTFSMNVPTNEGMHGAISMNGVGSCVGYLKTDSVYTFNMVKVREKDLCEFSESFYTRKHIRFSPGEDRFEYRTDVEEEGSKFKYISLMPYVDIDQVIYNVRWYSPSCYIAHFGGYF